MKPILKSRIEQFISDLDIFYQKDLQTRDQQIKSDMQVITAMCRIQGEVPRPYLEYYRHRLRERYEK